MSDQQTQPVSAPAPKIKKRAGPSLVWIIPLVTALVGGWLIIKTLSEKGPEVTISFKTAEGIEAGKTRIKYKNIDVGTVTELSFSDDFSNVILTAEFNHGTEQFLRRDTRFWVVKPRLSLREVSGLGTLVSGAYIEIEPGHGTPQRHFTGMEIPPVVKADEIGKKIILMTEKLGSVDIGSPIYFQGIMAGEVLGYELGNDRKSVYIHAFIKTPFDELVRGNSRFWNVSGMDVAMSADGFKMHTESIQSLIYGGIAFETPHSEEHTVEEVDKLIFTLYDNYEQIQEKAYTKKSKFVLFFDSTVRGLNIGAPVEFKGIKIGAVTDIHLEYNSEDMSFLIPVEIEIEPERIIERGNKASMSPYKTMSRLVERGLRAQLQTGSLLTGQLFIEMGIHEDAPLRLVGGDLPVPELPTISSGVDAIGGFLTKLEKIEIDKIGEHLLSALDGAKDLLNAPELHDSVTDVRGSMKSLKSILAKLDKTNIEDAVKAGHQVLAKIDTTLSLANGVLRPDSPVQHSVIQMTNELEEAARSVRTLVDMLERDPQSILFGKDKQGK